MRVQLLAALRINALILGLFTSSYAAGSPEHAPLDGKPLRTSERPIRPVRRKLGAVAA